MFASLDGRSKRCQRSSRSAARLGVALDAEAAVEPVGVEARAAASRREAPLRRRSPLRAAQVEGCPDSTMPKLVVKVDHTKTKKKIQKENKILVKEKNEDRHVGFKAYGDDGETGGTKLGKNGIVEWRADPKQEAAKKQQAKEKKIYDADHKGKEHAGDNKFIQNFDKNASKGLRTIQVGAKSPNEAPDHDAEGAALAAKANAIADRHHAEDARMKEERKAAKAQREADALADSLSS